MPLKILVERERFILALAILLHQRGLRLDALRGMRIAEIRNGIPRCYWILHNDTVKHGGVEAYQPVIYC